MNINREFIRRFMVIAAIGVSTAVHSGYSQPLDSTSRIGEFKNAVSMSVDPLGNIFVLDGQTSELFKYDPDRRLRAKTGGYGWEQGTFDRPADVVAPNGLFVYVADYGNHRIQQFDRNLNYVSTYSTRQDEEQAVKFGYPSSVALSRFGSMFIVDGENKRIVKVTPDKTIERSFGDIGSGAGKLSMPQKVRVAPDDRVYVIDGNSVVLFDIFGNFIRRLGTGQFNQLHALCLDQDTAYVLDSCDVYSLGKGDSLCQRLDIQQFRSQLSPCDLTDVQIAGGTIYFLTRHTIIRQQLRPERDK